MISQEKIHTTGMHVLIQLKNTNTFLFLLRSDYKNRDIGHRDLVGGGLTYGEYFQPALFREMKEEAGITLSPEEKESLKLLGTYQERRNKEQTKWGSAILYHIIIENKDIVLSHEHTEYKRLTLEQASTLTPKRAIVSKVIELMKDQ